jgi:hypothetical protein
LTPLAVAPYDQGQLLDRNTIFVPNQKLQLVNRRTEMERRRNTNNPLAGFLPIVTAGGLIFSDHREIPDRRLPP